MNKKFKLDEIVKIAGRVGWKGYTVEDLRDEGPWVIGANDITIDNQLDLSKAKHISREKYEESPEIMIEKDDILIVKVGSTIGKVAIVNKEIGEACINPNSVILKNCKVNPSYLYYYLISPAGQSFLKNNSSASAQSALNQMTLKEMPVELPDEKTQIKVGKILNDLNSKIELNNRINAELEAMAKTIYDYWFVQFDFPHEFKTVKTDKSGRRTELVEVKPYKTSGGKMVWNEELKREIPEGWEVKELNRFSNTASGGTPLSTNKKYYENGNIPWINSGELNSPFIIEGKKFITKAGIENSSAKMFEANTLLVALYGATAGKVSLLQIEACTNQAVCAIIPKSKVYTNYLKFAFDDLYNHMINLSTGSARDNLSQDLIGDLKFIISDEVLLTLFNQIVHPIINKITLNLKENQKLTELRDWLLPMLMNGQVKVK
jgi:type I restriction enzyme S subunit